MSDFGFYHVPVVLQPVAGTIVSVVVLILLLLTVCLLLIVCLFVCRVGKYVLPWGSAGGSTLNCWYAILTTTTKSNNKQLNRSNIDWRSPPHNHSEETSCMFCGCRIHSTNK
jgi:hypothetical protein